MSLHHHPAAEAAAVVGGTATVRVLEPSPPTVSVGPFFADDPASRGDDDGVVVTPTSGGDQTWDDLVADRPALADFARDRWLGNRRSLAPVPEGYSHARDAFHRLAYGVVAEARRLVTTKFGLRYTRGGFGTPFFGADEQVRVEGHLLIHQTREAAEAHEITTLRAAGDFLGLTPATAAAEHDSPELGDLDERLAVDAAVGEFLGNWYGLAWGVLEELRLTPGGHDPERTQLWPGHFDAAIAMGDADANGRATFGFSPGDHGHDEPYLYVGAWGDVDGSDPYWAETAFNGASMSYAELLTHDDPYAAALDFFRTGYAKLAGRA